ncbi:hypothetical protein L6164_021056 [Bauhinia variegata]|uniref:Uncharacterized protein n=1 Tax=Bauhinia variegata TaxID=167791 RepID=A0ACB9MX11_BAUVA|nr:hypothetical protein L6164_021056 [Bauhinia variegata]
MVSVSVCTNFLGLFLIGRVVTDLIVPIGIFRMVMQSMWGDLPRFRIIKLALKIFHIFFGEEPDLRRVLRSAPWTFQNSFVLLTRWTEDLLLEHLRLDEAMIWIHIWGLPYYCKTVAVGNRLGAKVGIVENVGLF